MIIIANIVFICEKKPKDEKNKVEQKNILDLINFSKERIDILRNKPNEKITNFFNLKLNELNTQLIKVEETPEANKSKISQENPAANEKDSKNKKKDDKKSKAQKGDQNPPAEEEQVIEPVTKLDLKENVVVIYRVLDVLFKSYPNLAYSQKKGMSLKKVMKKYSYEEYPTYSAAESKKDGLMSIKYLTSDLTKKTSQDEGNNLMKDLSGVTSGQEHEEKNKKDLKKEEKNDNSTQRKDIFYNSFKNIKERHQFREERINKLNHQKKKIIKELKEQNKNKKK